MKTAPLFLEVRKASAPEVERRGNIAQAALEYRAGEAGKPGKVTGYAAVWGAKAQELRWFTEEIRKGAFADSLTKRDQVALAHHDWSKPLARRSAGTLSLTEDDTGLRVEFQLPDTTDGRDMDANLRNGNVKGFSFGMAVSGEEWRWAQAAGELDHRTVTKADLYEVSPVTLPAYDATVAEVSQRSHEAAKKQRPPAADTVSLATRRAQIELAELAG